MFTPATLTAYGKMSRIRNEQHKKLSKTFSKLRKQIKKNIKDKKNRKQLLNNLQGLEIETLTMMKFDLYQRNTRTVFLVNKV